MKTTVWILASLLMLVSCGSDKHAELSKLKKDRDALNEKIALLEKEINATDSTAKKKLVSISEIKPSVFKHFIEVQGRLDGDQNVAVYPQASGIITNIYVTIGQQVNKGQILAKLDDVSLQQAINEIQTNLELATKLYNKQKALWDQNIGSEVQYLQAKASKEALESRLAQTKDQLNMMHIKSPITGSLEDAPIKIGQMVNPAVPAFRVVNFSSIKIVADVAESYASKINNGDMVKVYFPDINKEMDGKVNFSSKYINPINRTFQIEVHLNGGANILKANMVSYVRINDYTNNNAITIPINYVQNDQKGSYVLIAEQKGNNYEVSRKDIKVGSSYNGLAEIQAGINVGDKIITNGYLDLETNDLITF